MKAARHESVNINCRENANIVSKKFGAEGWTAKRQDET